MYSDENKNYQSASFVPYSYLPFALSEMSQSKKERMVKKFHPDRWEEPTTKEEKCAALEILAHEMITTQAFSKSRLNIVRGSIRDR